MPDWLPPPARCVSIGSCPVGPAPVKIIASVMASSEKELLAGAAEVEKLPCDIIEWRADYFTPAPAGEILAAAAKLRRAVGKPVLFTLRTTAEGGLANPGRERYAALIAEVAASGFVDAVDIELEREHAAQASAKARSAGVPVIASFHDFKGTPAADILLGKFLRMDGIGADILKIAVAPRSPEDILALLSASVSSRRKIPKPVIAIAMGQAGALSRVTGKIFGSAATFAAGTEASAPGQFPAGRMRELMETLCGGDS